MNQRFSKITPQPWAQAVLLLGVCFLLYFVNLGQWDLRNPDEPPYNFYTGIVRTTVLEKEEALSCFLSSQERVFCLLRFRDFLKFPTAEGHADFQMVLRHRVGDGEFVLISNQ